MRGILRLLPACTPAVCLLLLLPLWAIAADAPPSPVSDAPSKQSPAGRIIWITMLWDINIGRNPDRFELVSLLPRTIAGRQQIEAVFTNRKPAKTFTRNGNFYARWQLSSPANGSHQIMTAIQATLFSYDVAAAIAPPKVASPRSLRHDRSEERMIEAGSDEIRQAAARIPAGSSDLETARNISNFVGESLQYRGFVARDGGALGALQAGAGDCTDYVDLFVALCRAKDIPARHLSGILTQWVTVPGHSWAEFYTPQEGWVLTDPLHADLGKSAFGHLDAKYLQLSAIRNDDELNEGMLYRWGINGPGGATVQFICSERAESPLPAFGDTQWFRVQ